MKKSVLLLTAVLLLSCGFAQAAPDSIDIPYPQFINPFYDSYAHSYQSAVASGRAGAGVAFMGGVENILINPAAYAPDKASMALEALIKPPVEVSGFSSNTRFSSPIPFGLFAVGGKLGAKLSGSLVYSQPKALYLDGYSIPLFNNTYAIDRFPKYYLHQFTANLGYHISNLHLGLSLHNQIHYQDDVPVMQTFERIDDHKYVLRVEPGILYESERGAIGLTLTPPSNVDWDLKYVNYDTLLPLKVGIGTLVRHGNANVMVDLDYEQFSAVHSGFSDRLKVHTGLEIERGKIRYRLGYLYAPEVFKGKYNIPFNTASVDSSDAWDGVQSVAVVKTNTQHILSVGASVKHKYGYFSLALMQDVAGKAPFTQISLALNFDLEAFRSKDFLRYPDEVKRKNKKN